MSRSHWIVGVAVLLSACAPERDFIQEARILEADLLARQLGGDEAEENVTRILAREKGKLDDAGIFSILESELDCGDVSLKALYNPYRQAFVLTFRNKKSAHEEVRALRVNGKPLFVADKPFAPRQTLFLSPSGSLAKQGLYEVTKKFPETFPGGQNVELDITAEAMSAVPVGARDFTYQKRAHRGWKVKLHVFSDDETKTIDDHGRRRRRARALELFYRELPMLHGEHARIAEVKGLLDEEREKVKKELAATAAPPLAALAKSLSIEHTPPCPAARP